MQTSSAGRQRLALDEDCERLLTLLSVATNRAVSEREVVPSVTAAMSHWQRGDKALANLRLIFGSLRRAVDPRSAERVALAAHLLDNGVSPIRLMQELGFAPEPEAFAKYNPNHVPAGNGRRSGQFDFRSGAIVIASQVRPESGETEEKREKLELTTPEEEIANGRGADPFVGVIGAPVVPSGKPAPPPTPILNQLSAAARTARDTIGPGKGPVYGTKVHTEFAAQIKSSDRDDLITEQSYLYGNHVRYGTPGSIRIDAIFGPVDCPEAAFDLKTGTATLSPARIEKLLLHMPKEQGCVPYPIYEIRP